jgi:hypothetical protein
MADNHFRSCWAGIKKDEVVKNTVTGTNAFVDIGKGHEL